jgi:hypothetical protein
MAKKMTKAMSEKYVKGGGCMRPFCGSQNIQADAVDNGDSELNKCYQEVQCLDCSAWWTDEYRLVGCDNSRNDPVEGEKCSS